MKKNFILAALFCFVLATISCGPKAFIKGQYDDVSRENLMNDQWSETDVQKAVADLVGSLMGSASLNQAKKMPVVMVTNLLKIRPANTSTLKALWTWFVSS